MTDVTTNAEKLNAAAKAAGFKLLLTPDKYEFVPLRALQPALAQGDERQAFELEMSKSHNFAWSDIEDKCADGDFREGEYRDQQLQDFWEVWQAALSAQREQPMGFGRTELSVESADWFEQNTNNPQPNQKLKDALERGRNVLESMQPQGVAPDDIETLAASIENRPVLGEHGKRIAAELRALLGQREG